MADLIEIGFWAPTRADTARSEDVAAAEAGADGRDRDEREGRPNPKDLVDSDWAHRDPDAVDALVRYAKNGIVESHELAYSYCRFGPACTADRRELGCATLTDGTYVWPEGLAHYVERHNVRPPQPFIEHVARNRARDGDVCRNHLVWEVDAATRRGEARAMPLATQTVLLSHSTLRPRDAVRAAAAQAPQRPRRQQRLLVIVAVFVASLAGLTALIWGSSE